MKLAIAWLGAVALAVVMASAGSCSINHRSGDLVCETQTDCDPIGRVCVDGYCIETMPPRNDGGIDTPRDAPRDMGVDTSTDCPAQCTSCTDDKTCVIDCSIDSCGGDAPLVCPTGFDCTFQCNAPNSCRSGIDCSEANSCTVNCTASGSCRDLDCGGGKCKVQCSASQACRGMDCGGSCGCDITCNNGASCQDNVCPLGCAVPGLPTGDCSSSPALCDTCQ